MATTHDCELTIILAGQSGVGKTSLTKRFYSNQFKDTLDPTFAVSKVQKNLVMQGRNIKLVIYDLPGDERCQYFTTGYYSVSDGALLVYDVNDMATFDNLSSYLQKLRTTECSLLVVGNKKDQPATTTSKKKIKEYPENEELEIMETNAKTGENVQQVFEYLILKMLIKKRLVDPDSCIASETADKTDLSHMSDGAREVVSPGDVEDPVLSREISNCAESAALNKELCSHVENVVLSSELSNHDANEVLVSELSNHDENEVLVSELSDHAANEVLVSEISHHQTAEVSNNKSPNFIEDAMLSVELSNNREDEELCYHVPKDLIDSYEFVDQEDCRVERLPPVLALDESIEELRLNRLRRMSTESISSLVTEMPEFHDMVRQYREARADEARRKSKNKCSLM